MATRVISIKVVYENREAIVAARALAISQKAQADASQKAAIAAQKLATEQAKAAKVHHQTANQNAAANQKVQASLAAMQAAATKSSQTLSNGLAKAQQQAALASQRLATAQTQGTTAATNAALAQARLAAHTQRAANAANQQSRGFGSLLAYSAKLFGAFQLVSRAFNMVTNELDMAFTGAYKLQQNMTLLGAAGSLTAAQMDSVRQVIHGIASELPVSQEQISAGALELVRMGYTGQELTDVLGSVTKASVLMGTSVEDTANAVFTASNIFGYTSKQSEEVAAKLVYAANASALSLQQVGVALNFTAGAAATAGVGLEPTLAMMAALRNLGVGASTIGTAMRTFFRELSVGGKAVKAIGGDINSLGLVETLKRFTKLDGRTFADIFSKPASSALQLLQKDLKKTDSSFERFQEAMVGDEAQKVYEEVGDRFGKDLPGAVQLFRNELSHLADDILTGKLGSAFAWLLNQTTIVLSAYRSFATAAANPFDTAKEFAERVVLESMDKGQSKAFGPLPSGFDPNQGKSIYVPKPNLCGDDTDKQAEAVKALKDSYQKWREELEWLNLTGHSEDLEKTKKSLAEYAAKFKALGELGDANSALRARNEILADQEKAIIDADKAAQALLDTWAKSMKEFDAAVLAEANEGLKALSINLEGLGNVLAGDEWGEFEALAQKLAELREYYGALGDEDKVARIDALARAMGKLEDNSTWSGVWKARGRELEEFSLQAETARVVMGAMDSSIQLLSQGLAENLVGAITNTKTAFVDFGDIAKQILISLTAELIKMLALMAAMKIIKGIGLGAAAAATGGAAAPVVAGAGFVASGIDKVVRTPTAFVTGEAGAERVTVTPRARINRDNGGGGVTVVIQGDVYGAEKFNEAVATANRKVQYV